MPLKMGVKPGTEVSHMDDRNPATGFITDVFQDLHLWEAANKQEQELRAEPRHTNVGCKVPASWFPFWDLHCGIARKTATYGAGILCSCQFESWLLHFGSWVLTLGRNHVNIYRIMNYSTCFQSETQEMNCHKQEGTEKVNRDSSGGGNSRSKNSGEGMQCCCWGVKKGVVPDRGRAGWRLHGQASTASSQATAFSCHRKQEVL